MQNKNIKQNQTENRNKKKLQQKIHPPPAALLAEQNPLRHLRVPHGLARVDSLALGVREIPS